MVFTSRPPDFLDTQLVVEAGERHRPSPAAEPILGMVIFTTHRGERAEAILDAGGKWRCPQLPVLDRVLNILYEPLPGGAWVPFGHECVYRVAVWLKGVAEIPYKP